MNAVPERVAPAFQSVALEDMLRARDRRARSQQHALFRFGRPVVSVTLVMPGPVKATSLTRFVMNVASAELDALLHLRNWRPCEQEPLWAVTGPELLCVVEAGPLDLKRALAALEDSHPLGRLWDFDVICPRQGVLSRGGLGLEPRRCLICNEAGHACARARRHELPALLAAIEAMVDDYCARSN